MTTAVAERRQVEFVRSRPARVEWPTLKPVLIFHLITRAAVIAGLVVASVLSRRSFSDVVTRWDGIWYWKVAVDGYPKPLPIHPTGRFESSTAAFFPLFPLLIKGLISIGIPYWVAGMMINLVASSAAVLIIVLVGSQYLDRRSAQLLGCLWTAYPMSAVLTTTYTESVFTLLGAASLLFLLRRHWVSAGVAAALAGGIRSPGIIFAGAVCLAALEATIRHRDWRSLIGAAIAPLGFVISIVYIGLSTGRMDAWQITEHDGWHTTMTFGSGWLAFLRTPPSSIQDHLHLAMALFGIAVLALTIATIMLRPPLPIIGLVAVGFFAAFAFGGVVMNAAPRVMMSFFPFLAPLAILMSRLPRTIQWIILGVGSAAAAVIGGYFFAFAPVPV
jgi:hypothetical protein